MNVHVPAMLVFKMDFMFISMFILVVNVGVGVDVDLVFDVDVSGTENGIVDVIVNVDVHAKFLLM